MIRKLALLAVVLIIPLTAAGLLSGCSGSGGDAAFFTVSERNSFAGNGLIAFASFGGNGLRYINTINERGGSVDTLTPSDNDEDLLDEGGFNPSFSPDGALVAIASRRGPSNDLYLISATVGDRPERLVQLTTDAGSDTQPIYSPVGDKIAFTTNRDGDNNIYVLTVADPTVQTPVDQDPANDQWACFDPTGTKVAFQSDRAGNTDIWIKDLTSGTLTQVTTSPSRDEQPAWSPDGSTILFTSNRAGDFDLWSVAPDGTGSTQITSDGRSDGYPQWRPDGLRITFTRDRQAWVADPNGANPEQLTRTF
jgi:Tol biopolymer transport system component